MATAKEVFGWVKTVGVMAKTRHRGLEKVDWQFTLALAAYNLARMSKLLAPEAWSGRRRPGIGEWMPPKGAEKTWKREFSRCFVLGAPSAELTVNGLPSPRCEFCQSRDNQATKISFSRKLLSSCN